MAPPSAKSNTKKATKDLTELLFLAALDLGRYFVLASFHLLSIFSVIYEKRQLTLKIHNLCTFCNIIMHKSFRILITKNKNAD